MNEKLLQSFPNEEGSDHVRKSNLRVSYGSFNGCAQFEFNRFNVTIDCESDHATIEDDLNPGPKGQGSWPLEKFVSALWQELR